MFDDGDHTIFDCVSAASMSFRGEERDRVDEDARADVARAREKRRPHVAIHARVAPGEGAELQLQVVQAQALRHVHGQPRQGAAASV